MNRRDFSLGLVSSAALITGGCSTAIVNDSDTSLRAALPTTPQIYGVQPPVLIRIFKEESEFELWGEDQGSRFSLIQSFPNCRWSGRLGPKRQHGDGQSPEGIYSFTAEMVDAPGKRRRSINVGYPNGLESKLGYTGKAVIAQGDCSSDGCIAFDDDSGTEIFSIVEAALQSGQESVQVQIFPFRMTLENMVENRDNPNIEFWLNLKTGSDVFDETRKPLNVSFCGKKYQFDATFKDNVRVDPIEACPERLNPELPSVMQKNRRTLQALDFFQTG